jgi:hypothetical protein
MLNKIDQLLSTKFTYKLLLLNGEGKNRTREREVIKNWKMEKSIGE